MNEETADVTARLASIASKKLQTGVTLSASNKKEISTVVILKRAIRAKKTSSRNLAL